MSTSGQTRENCSSTASDHVCRSPGGNVKNVDKWARPAVLLHEERGDQEATEHEEDVDADEPAGIDAFAPLGGAGADAVNQRHQQHGDGESPSSAGTYAKRPGWRNFSDIPRGECRRGVAEGTTWLRGGSPTP